jgi:hypothetical protein
MASSADFIEFLKDQLRGLGHVTSRRMFSGAGIYCDGVIFALLLRDTLYFKVDDGNRAAYEGGLSRSPTRPVPGHEIKATGVPSARRRSRRWSSGRAALAAGQWRPRPKKKLRWRPGAATDAGAAAIS